MSEAVDVKTLVIDETEVSARRGQTNGSSSYTWRFNGD